MTKRLGKMNFLKNIRINSVNGANIKIDKIKENYKYIKQDIKQKKSTTKSYSNKNKKKETKMTISKKMTKKEKLQN